MEIVVKQNGIPYVIALEGRLDTNASPQLDEYTFELSARGINDLVVDMAKCDYVSSAGLRVIVSMHKRATVKGSLVFQNVEPAVMDIFDATGFNTILTIE